MRIQLALLSIFFNTAAPAPAYGVTDAAGSIVSPRSHRRWAHSHPHVIGCVSRQSEGQSGGEMMKCGENGFPR